MGQQVFIVERPSKNGASFNTVETAVTRCVRTGVAQMSGRITEKRAEEVGCEHYLVSSHLGARPSHAVWQGQVYKIHGSDKKYKNFKETTGYGTGPGLCGWNCRHSFSPFFPEFMENNQKQYSVEENEEAYNKRQEEMAELRAQRQKARKLRAYTEAREQTDDPELKRQLSEKIEKLTAHDSKTNYKENPTLRKRDSKQYERYKKILGDKMPSIEDYKKIKYNEDDLEEWEEFKAYVAAVKSGELTPLADFKLYRSISKEIDKKLVGTVTSNGIEITGKSKHFIARVIGSVEQRRSGVPVDDILPALQNPDKIEPIRHNNNGDSQRFIKDCVVAVNPDTGILIQVNPRSVKKRGNK